MSKEQKEQAPERIWLQDWHVSGHGATWCAEMMSILDVEYVRADPVAKPPASPAEKQQLAADMNEARQRAEEMNERFGKATNSYVSAPTQPGDAVALHKAVLLMRGLMGLVQLLGPEDKEYTLNHRYVDADVFLTEYESQNADRFAE